MLEVKGYLLDPATGRYEDVVLRGTTEEDFVTAIARMLEAQSVAPLIVPPEAPHESQLVAWTDVEARSKPQTCCWMLARSDLAVPGRTVLTGYWEGTTINVPFESTTIDDRITTYAARIAFPRPGPEPAFATKPTVVLERTYNG